MANGTAMLDRAVQNPISGCNGDQNIHPARAAPSERACEPIEPAASLSKLTSTPHCARDAAILVHPHLRRPPTRAERQPYFNRTLPGLHGPSSNLYDGMSIIHAGCSDLVMLDRLRQYLKELADADREASRLVREHGSNASQVIAADIEVARKQGDAPTVRRLERIASAIAAIEESPAALLHR